MYLYYFYLQLNTTQEIYDIYKYKIFSLASIYASYLGNEITLNKFPKVVCYCNRYIFITFFHKNSFKINESRF